ncbi:MAG: Hpt domain-containing protein [Balneola sp.]|nr:MAG: Hpt domain-containing protein [Balneola sp.]
MKFYYLDDSKFDRMAFTRLMRSFEGLTFEVVESFKELDEKYSKDESAILIRDCHLPGERINSLDFSATYFVSGSRPTESMRSALGISDDHFFLKPLNEDHINRVIYSNPQTEELFELDFIKELSGGDEDFEKELINIFIEEVPKQCSQLEEALSGEDQNTVAEVLHALRTKIRTFGIENVDLIAEEIEYKTKENAITDWESAGKDIESIVRDLESVVVKMKELL